MPGFQRLPNAACVGDVLARPVPRVALEVAHQRLQLGEQLAPPRHREGADDPDRAQAPVVVEAEEERADRVGPRLVDAVAGQHAVGGADVLDLRHHALVGLVGQLRVLGDDAVEPGTLEALEPLPRELGVLGDGREVDRRPRAGERRLERRAALGERPRGQVLVAEREQVEGDEARRGLAGEQVDAAGGGVEALLERPEVEPPVGAGDHDLAVDDGARRQALACRRDHLGEVARHRAGVATADLDLVAVAEHDRAEAVPLGLVERPGWEVGADLRQHRRDRRHDGQPHPPMMTRSRSAGPPARR